MSFPVSLSDITFWNKISKILKIYFNFIFSFKKALIFIGLNATTDKTQKVIETSRIKN